MDWTPRRRALILVTEYLTTGEFVKQMLLICRGWKTQVDTDEVWSNKLRYFTLPWKELTLTSPKVVMKLFARQSKRFLYSREREIVSYDLHCRRMVVHVALPFTVRKFCLLPNGSLFINDWSALILDVRNGHFQELPSCGFPCTETLSWKEFIYVFGTSVMRFDVQRWEWGLVPLEQSFKDVLSVIRRENVAYMLLVNGIAAIDLETAAISQHQFEARVFNQHLPMGFFHVDRRLAVLNRYFILLIDLATGSEEMLRKDLSFLPSKIQCVEEDEKFLYFGQRTELFRYEKATHVITHFYISSVDLSFRIRLRLSAELCKALSPLPSDSDTETCCFLSYVRYVKRRGIL